MLAPLPLPLAPLVLLLALELLLPLLVVVVVVLVGGSAFVLVGVAGMVLFASPCEVGVVDVGGGGGA